MSAIAPIKRLSLKTIAAIKATAPRVHEAFQQLQDYANRLTAYVEAVTGTDATGGSGGGIGGPYVPLGLLSFTNFGNVINVAPPPYPGGTPGPPGPRPGPGGGDGNGPGTGGRRPDLGSRFAEFEDAAAQEGARNGVRIIAVHNAPVIGINGATRGQPVPPSSAMVVLMQSAEPKLDHFEVDCWLDDRVTGAHVSQVGTRQTAGATWDPVAKLWTQSGFLMFSELDTGVKYSFRARVATPGGGPTFGATSPWSAWAQITAGDTTGPNPTYSPTRDLVQGVLHVNANPSGAPSDTAGYLFYFVRRAVPTVMEPAPTDDTPPSTPLTSDAKVILPLAGLDVDDLWVRAVDSSGNKQVWTYLGFWTIPAPQVTGLTVTEQIISVEHARGKSPYDELDTDCTTPNDPDLSGLSIYLFNRGNAGALEKIAHYDNVPINAAVALAPTSYLEIAAVPDHAVTMYVVGILVTGVEVLPVTAQPSWVFPHGLHGLYSGPAAPSGLIIENAGNNLYLEWDDSFDKMILEYWIVRAPDGNHNAPNAGIPISAAAYVVSGTVTTVGITTAVPHGRSVGDLFMVAGATGLPGINGAWQVSAVISSTQLEFVIEQVITGTYTPTTAVFWANARRIVVPHSINDATNFAEQNYLDKDFAVSDYDPANPNIFRYWIAARTTDARTSGYTAASPIELIPDPAGINQPDPLASVLNRFFNAQFGSNTTTTNQDIGPGDGQGTPPAGFQIWTGDSFTPGKTQWVSDGANATGEASIQDTSGLGEYVQQEASARKFYPGESLTFSTYAASDDVGKQDYIFRVYVIREDRFAGTIEIFSTDFNASLLEADYKRFTFSVMLGTAAGWGTDVDLETLTVRFGMVSTGPNVPHLLIVKPMLNEGLTAANWTATQDVIDTPGLARKIIHIRPVTTPTPPALIHRDSSAATWGT